MSTTDTLTQAEQEALGTISTTTYERRVLVHFMGGRATDEEWAALAKAACYASEQCYDWMADIDRAVLRQEGHRDAL
jgi:hypothetical protein